MGRRMGRDLRRIIPQPELAKHKSNKRFILEPTRVTVGATQDGVTFCKTDNWRTDVKLSDDFAEKVWVGRTIFSFR